MKLVLIRFSLGEIWNQNLETAHQSLIVTEPRNVRAAPFHWTEDWRECLQQREKWSRCAWETWNERKMGRDLMAAQTISVLSLGQ